MKPSVAYTIGAIVFVVCVAIGVYYLIPGIHHVFADPPTATHIKHAVVFFALGVVALIGARFAANARSAN
ncbi:MAG TPA: hypothetical protein VFN11_12425 [Ktedonobacterales bacterium]|nr:hypothetical protein [Ktedonobacterales bacterium]